MSEIPDPEELLRSQDLKREQKDAQEVAEALPPVTTLSIDCVDGRGKRYQGEFYFKVPTLGDRLRIGNLKLGYFPGGEPPDATSVQMVHIICYLTVTIRFDDGRFKKPHWWDPWNLYDATPFAQLYKEAAQYERKFHGEDSDAGDIQAIDQEQEPRTGGDDAAPVGRKVRASSERRETLTANSR